MMRTLQCTHMKKYMTATDARKHWYEVIETAAKPGVTVIITHEGLPKVVVVSFEKFEEWRDTMLLDSKRRPRKR